MFKRAQVFSAHCVYVCVHGRAGQTPPHCRALQRWRRGLRSVPTATPTSSRIAASTRGTYGPTKVCFFVPPQPPPPPIGPLHICKGTIALGRHRRTSVPVGVNKEYFSSKLTYDLSLHLSFPHAGCHPGGRSRLQTGCRRRRKKLAR